MKHLIVVVFDQVAKTVVSPLMLFWTREAAIRAYVEAVQEGKGFRQAHARDHELRLVGEIDLEGCTMKSFHEFEVIARGANLFAPVAFTEPKAVNDA